MNNVASIERKPREMKAAVYCPICTHTVEGSVLVWGRTGRVKAGERCPRCGSSLEAGVILRVQRAA